MTYKQIRLGKSIQPDRLEKILVEAAKERGFKVKVIDEKSEHYELGSVRKVQEYARTTVRLKKLFLPLMEIDFNKYRPNDEISVSYGSSCGLATTGTVEKYLTAVSKRL